jgi:hypothetical protein
MDAVEKFDRMERRTFGLGDGAGSGSLNVAVLANRAMVQIAKS